MIKQSIKKLIQLSGYTLRKMEVPDGIAYDQDGLRSIHNHDFMKNERFINAYKAGCLAEGKVKFIEWRAHTILWAASYALRLEGDFVECGVFKGLLSRAIMEYVNWNSTGKCFWLLDRYEGANFNTYQAVKDTFNSFNAKVVKGEIPKILNSLPDFKVSYLSIDMNSASPEISALEYFWPKMVAGAICILDDYAYYGYKDQKIEIDKFASAKGIEILSLPTGQGMFIKP